MAATTTTPSAPSGRLKSLDQFRGYTMFGMLVVNFLGGYAVCPRLLKHSNDYCSYADTIMPQFLFAVGFAMRLSLGKRREVTGKLSVFRILRRIFGLAAIAIAWYTICDWRDVIKAFHGRPLGEFVVVAFKRQYFQTLLHIAVTSLWILPIVTRSARILTAYAVASGVLHVLLSWWFNFDWVFTEPMAIDGGPLGFLTWAIPALCGSLACDAVRSSGPAATPRILVCGILTMLLGWGFSFASVLYNVKPDHRLDVSLMTGANRAQTAPAGKLKDPKLAYDPVVPSIERWHAYDGSLMEPPFVRPPDARQRKWNYWMMSQRSGTLSYLTFTGGLSLFLFGLFLWACDRRGWRLGLFRTLGTNSLAAYLFHDIADWVISPWFPKNSPSVTSTIGSWATYANVQLAMDVEQSKYMLQLAFALFGFLCFATCVYAACRVLQRFGLYIRV